MNPPKVLVGTVIGAKFPEECVHSHLLLDYTPIQYLTNRTGVAVGSTNINKHAQYYRRLKEITKARNWLLKEAFKLDWDYLLWIDSDVFVFPDTLTELIKYIPQEKVVSAFSRYRQGTSVLTYTYRGYAPWVGFNCVLIAREVHKRVGEFIADNRGEDVGYCERIRKAGYKIRVAKEVYVDHRFFHYDIHDETTVDTKLLSKVAEQPDKIPAHNGLFAAVFGKYGDTVLTVTCSSRQAHVNEPHTRDYILSGQMPVIRLPKTNYVQWASDNGLTLTAKPIPPMCFRMTFGELKQPKRDVK